ncbi:hypothetical protein [Paenibacillus sinopodophylli]|uniref:hypothetical protein n=1 Tax=Paenibacillus sinopodophylli TaxID=1837342 RepID=UPI00110CE5F6|nr:hypothetical protein [Paenibacillus sinopodophylli]
MIGLLYGLYVLLSALLLFILYRKSLREFSLRFLIVALIPVIGWLLPVFWPRSWFVHAGEKLDEYIVKQQEEMSVSTIGIHKKLEVEKELNIISIEDALIVSEHSARRRVMIDVLKQDSMNYLEVLQTAVSNEDTETSHYAVSAIMEAKRKLSLSIQELSVQYEHNKTDEHLLRAYAEVLKGFMRSGFLDERTSLKYKYTYVAVLNHLITHSEDAESAFAEKLNTEMELGEYLASEETCHAYIARYPLSEDAYLCLIQLYFMTKSADKLQNTIDTLKKSPLRLSNKALTMVRFWSEGA